MPHCIAKAWTHSRMSFKPTLIHLKQDNLGFLHSMSISFHSLCFILETMDQVPVSVCGRAEQGRVCLGPPRAGSAVAPAVTKARSSVWPFTQALRRGEWQENSWCHSSSRSSAIPRVSRTDGEAGAWREMLAVDVVSHFANRCKALSCL